jgi:hypothetical protein
MWDNGGMYASRAFSRSFIETKTFWNLHRTWAAGSVPVSALLLRGLLQGWDQVTNVREVVIFTVAGFALSWVGSFVINLIRTAALLDQERREEIEKLQKLLSDEQANKLMPDLQGTFCNVSISQFPYADQSKPGAWIDLRIFACNYSHAETTIREMVVTASDLSGRVHRFTKNIQVVLLAPWNVFRRGVGLSFSAQAGLDGIGFNMIDPDSVKVSLIDAFGVEHPLSRGASTETI